MKLKISSEVIEKLLAKYDTAKKIEEILAPFVDQYKEIVLAEILEAKTSEQLFKAQGKLEILTRIKNEVKYIITMYEKEVKNAEV
jgi:hypothetical protein